MRALKTIRRYSSIMGAKSSPERLCYMRLVVVDCLAHEMVSLSIFESDMDFCEKMTQKCEGKWVESLGYA